MSGELSHTSPALGPVWLLDVDGVLNASRPGWSAAPHSATVYANGRPWKFRFEPRVLAAVRSIVLDGQADVRWSTTWVEHATEVERVFRLPALPLAFTVEDAVADVSGAKVAAALNVVEVERRPLVWTDDMEVPGPGELRARLLSAGVPVLLIAPDERRGLRPEDVEQIREFIAAHQGHAGQ